VIENSHSDEKFGPCQRCARVTHSPEERFLAGEQTTLMRASAGPVVKDWIVSTNFFRNATSKAKLVRTATEDLFLPKRTSVLKNSNPHRHCATSAQILAGLFRLDT